MIDRKTATRRLINRWMREVKRVPGTRDIPLKSYITRNVRTVQEFDLLKEYDE